MQIKKAQSIIEYQRNYPKLLSFNEKCLFEKQESKKISSCDLQKTSQKGSISNETNQINKVHLHGLSINTTYDNNNLLNKYIN